MDQDDDDPVIEDDGGAPAGPPPAHVRRIAEQLVAQPPAVVGLPPERTVTEAERERVRRRVMADIDASMARRFAAADAAHDPLAALVPTPVAALLAGKITGPAPLELGDVAAVLGRAEQALAASGRKLVCFVAGDLGRDPPAPCHFIVGVEVGRVEGGKRVRRRAAELRAGLDAAWAVPEEVWRDVGPVVGGFEGEVRLHMAVAARGEARANLRFGASEGEAPPLHVEQVGTAGRACAVVDVSRGVHRLRKALVPSGPYTLALAGYWDEDEEEDEDEGSDVG